MPAALREVHVFSTRIELAFLVTSVAALAQTYVISTVAGGVPPPTPVVAVNASIGGAFGVAAGSGGNVYFTSLHCVFRLDASGVLARVAGTARPGYSGDGGQATSAQLSSPAGVVVDSVGNVYIADSSNHRVRKVSPSGIITTVAGTGVRGFSGDGGPATGAQLSTPRGMAFDGSGNLYVADVYNSRIRRIPPSGIITTVAGNGSYGYSGDGGPATGAELRVPNGVAVDGSGNLYVADLNNNRIRKVSPAGIITNVAGNGTAGFSGDGGPASSAQVSSPWGVAVDGAGNLYIADSNNHRIRKVSSSGIIITVAGGGAGIFSGDGGPATSAAISLPYGVAVDGTGNLCIADFFNHRIRKVSPSGIITTAAGSGAGGPAGDGGPATNAQLFNPAGVAVDGSGNLYVADSSSNRIRRVTPSGIITTVAGTGAGGFSGDGGPAISAQLYSPYGVAVDSSGNIYIADSFNNRIRRVAPSGIITTVAGTGVGGFSGDGAPAISAQLYSPYGVAVDGSGNIYIADSFNDRIRRVAPTGIITTVAGTGGSGFSGDDGLAISAKLNLPYCVAPDGSGNLYIADTNNHRLRKLSPGGIISTVAGTGAGGFTGDGGPATSAYLYYPRGVALDGSGNLYLTDSSGFRVRRVSSAGTISTVAGTGVAGFSGDGGPATSAQLYSPFGVAVDGSGNLYVAEGDANAVRLLRPATAGASLSIVTASPLPQGAVGIAYLQTLSAAGGATPYSWSVTSGALPGGLTLDTGGTISGTPATAGAYNYTTQVRDSASTTATKEFSLTIVSQSASLPMIFPGGVVNAASNAVGQPIAAGCLVSIYGANLAASTMQAGSLPLRTSLNDVSVTFNNVPARLVFVAPGQVNAQVPWNVLPSGVLSGNIPVVVTRGTVASAPATVSVEPFSPGIFSINSGVGNAIAINSDGSLAALTGSIPGIAARPAKAGDSSGLIILATGLGTMDSYPANGYNSADKLRRNLTTPEVLVGGTSAPVSFSGLSPQFVGVNQINITIPDGVPTADKVPLQLRLGGITTTDRVIIAVSGCCDSVTDSVSMTSAEGLKVSGQVGQLNPSSHTITYTLQSNRAVAIPYTLASSADWVTVSKTAGTLAASGKDSFTVSINSNANRLPAGSYLATVTFTEKVYGTTITRTVSLDLSAGACMNIAGQWLGTEKGTMTCTVTVSGQSETETDPVNSSDLITISQQGCQVSYTSRSMMAAFGSAQSLRQGEVDGSNVKFSGIMGQLAAGFSYDKNLYEASGTVGSRVINLTGSGALLGRGLWQGMDTTFSCTAATTATLTKWP